MADWIHRNNVEFDAIYKKMPDIYNEYLIDLSWREEGKLFPEHHAIKIFDSRVEEDILELFDGKRERCYFAFGMQDIDFYKSNDGKYAITHSPHEGLNIQFVFAAGEFEKLVSCFRSPVTN